MKLVTSRSGWKWDGKDGRVGNGVEVMRSDSSLDMASCIVLTLGRYYVSNTQGGKKINKVKGEKAKWNTNRNK